MNFRQEAEELWVRIQQNWTPDDPKAHPHHWLQTEIEIALQSAYSRGKVDGKAAGMEEAANILSDRWPTAVGAAQHLREAAKAEGGGVSD